MPARVLPPVDSLPGVFSGVGAIVVRTRLSWFSLKRELAFPVSEYTAIAGRDSQRFVKTRTRNFHLANRRGAI